MRRSRLCSFICLAGLVVGACSGDGNRDAAEPSTSSTAPPAESEAVPTAESEAAPTAVDPDATEVVPTAESEPVPTAVESDATESDATESEGGDVVSESESATVGSGEQCGLDVTIAFRESAPRDQMFIANDSTVPLALTAVEFDLSESVGNVIFDTLDGGAGVEVFQDFQVESGDASLAREPIAEDGASQLRLDFDSFAPGQSFAFSIDVDDQLVDSELGQIQVSGAELAGATVLLVTDSGSATAVFDETDSAQFIAVCSP